ncbi:MAG: efflux RND transporter periplasmic adaptor subunit [Nitrospinaceae bacterium]|jgi:RND family efflux transporter MFP subunit|nr:MAG: efflux RND transporter periplasmic adaptor subunit [Nitrospinaceae bacterium]
MKKSDPIKIKLGSMPKPSPGEEEETLFPNKKSGDPKGGNNTSKRSPWGKRIFYLALALGIFSLGFLAKPENLRWVRETAKNLLTGTIKSLEPAKEKVDAEMSQVMDKVISKEEAPPLAEAPLGQKPASTSERKIKYWQSPMNPSYTSDKPGKSPMGMDLVPVYEEPENNGDGIRINPTVTQNIGVKTETIKVRPLTRDIRAVGILAYDERQVAHIHTKYEGWIEKLNVDFTGQEVNKDDLLVEIYSPELVSTQEEFLLAMKYNETLKESPFSEIGKGAERLLQSTRRRLELFDVPEHQIEQLIQNKKITKTLHIHSPFRGFVIKKNVLKGMFVKPGMGLYVIANLNNIWVLADVYEYEIPWVKVGQEAEMSLTYQPNKTFKGRVTYIDPFMDPKTRTLKVRMEFDNPDWELKPDMYANVRLKSIISRSALAVPREAVIHSGEKEIVLVQTPKGNFESRTVKLGPEAKGYYQVLSGLKAGEKVVTSSSFLIDSESRLTESLRKMEK